MRDETLVLKLGKRQLEALENSLMLEPRQQAMIEAAQESGSLFTITGSWEDFDSLADQVAFEANHAESRRKQDLYDSICDKIERLISG